MSWVRTAIGIVYVSGDGVSWTRDAVVGPYQVECWLGPWKQYPMRLVRLKRPARHVRVVIEIQGAVVRFTETETSGYRLGRGLRIATVRPGIEKGRAVAGLTYTVAPNDEALREMVERAELS